MTTVQSNRKVNVHSRRRSASLSTPRLSTLHNDNHVFRPKLLGSRTTSQLLHQSRCRGHPHLSKSPILFPPSIEHLDLPSAPFSLPSLRERLLSHLSEVETKLQPTDEPHVPQLDVIEEAVVFVREGFEWLERFKSELGAHMPDLSDFDFELPPIPSLPDVRSHLPDLPDVKSKLREFDLADVRSRLPDLELDMRSSRLMESVSTSFDEARYRLSHLDILISSSSFPLDLQFPDAQSYIPALRFKIQTLRDHISSLDLPSPSNITIPSLNTPRRVLSELLPDLLGDEDVVEEAKKMRASINQVSIALVESCQGLKLIEYDLLPHRWRNNEFVITGYRFIPFSSWPSLVMSVFRFHNETTNIHTHFIPLLCLIYFAFPWASIFSFNGKGSLAQLPTLFNSLPVQHSGWPSLYIVNLIQTRLEALWQYVPPTIADSLISSRSGTGLEVDAIPRYLFLVAASACLLCSVIWHVSAGCADVWVVQAGARIDYVGIGWLISASVATVVYYAYQDHPYLLAGYISLTVATGIAGSVAPFQTWFDERKNKMKRIAFFLGLAGAAVLPLAHLCYLAGIWKSLGFIYPVVPSILCYLLGLVFYATHFPECLYPGKFDCTGGSHAIWHICIVVAIRLHWLAVEHIQSAVIQAQLTPS